MKATQLLEDLQFDNREAHAEPLYVDKDRRVIRFTLRPGQSIKEHNAPDSPFQVVVLQGEGTFTGKDGKEVKAKPNTLLLFDPGENHSIRAVNEDLVFVGFLHGAPSNVSEKVGGTIGRKSESSKAGMR